MHPAHALPPGKTAFAAGVSDHFVLGDERRALDDARRRPPGSPEFSRRAELGTLVALVEGPRLAPFVAARVGIAGKNEAGLSYAGSALRVDARHAFEWGKNALSVGVGLTASGLAHDALDLPGTDLSRAHGFGVDLPVLYGYRSDAELIAVWAGLRASFDHWSAGVALDQQGHFQLAARRIAAGPVLGLSVGLPPLRVGLELAVDYADVTGSLDRGGAPSEAHVAGWSVRPAGALIAKF